MKLKYVAQPQKILELIHCGVIRVDECLETGKVYDIPPKYLDACMETGFFEYVQEKKPVKKAVKEEEKEKE